MILAIPHEREKSSKPNWIQIFINLTLGTFSEFFASFTTSKQKKPRYTAQSKFTSGFTFRAHFQAHISFKCSF